MKDNVEVWISKGVQGQVFVQITFENCTLNFYFENGEIGIKTSPNLQSLLAWKVSACLRILKYFYETSTKGIFTKLLSAF